MVTAPGAYEAAIARATANAVSTRVTSRREPFFVVRLLCKETAAVWRGLVSRSCTEFTLSGDFP
jgi:hypothetical protein